MCKVLIAEDEHIVAQDLAKSLGGMGYDVAAFADTGADAVRIAQQVCPDVVLMDIRLRGDMDGIAAATEVWERWKIPVVFITSHSDPETVKRATNASPYGYIVKPFRPNELDATLRVAVRQNQLSREIFAEKDWFQVLLTEVSDGVIATDCAGRVQYMNRLAEKLTGWTTAQAAGKEIESVLRLRTLGAQVIPKFQVHEALRTGKATPRERFSLLPQEGRPIAIDESASPIHNSRGEIIGAVTVFLDVTVSVQLDEDREILIRELERSNEELSGFAHAVSHDLQAPVRAIKAYTELLARKAQDSPADIGANLVSTITRAADEMDQLIRSLLTYAQVGQQQVTPEPVSLKSLIETVLPAVEPLLADAEATIEYDDLPTIEADKVQIQQLIQNLLTNAAKYRKANRPLHVQISAESKRNRWLIAVKDNGQGIAPEHFVGIFEPLKRLHGREVPGTGIGLAMCRKIMERHGGRIWVESEGVDRGATFYFELYKGFRNANPG